MELGSVEKSQVIVTESYTTQTKYLERDFFHLEFAFCQIRIVFRQNVTRKQSIYKKEKKKNFKVK